MKKNDVHIVLKRGENEAERGENEAERGENETKTRRKVREMRRKIWKTRKISPICPIEPIKLSSARGRVHAREYVQISCATLAVNKAYSPQWADHLCSERSRWNKLDPRCENEAGLSWNQKKRPPRI